MRYLPSVLYAARSPRVIAPRIVVGFSPHNEATCDTVKYGRGRGVSMYRAPW
jgi:hypothetical protein